VGFSASIIVRSFISAPPICCMRANPSLNAATMARRLEAAQFLRDLLLAPPYRIHTVLTDNGIQFTNWALVARAFAHIFDRVCRENGIEHRLIKVSHPWINGQVERMNRTIKEAVVKRFHDDDRGRRRDILRISSTRITTPVDLSLSTG